MKATRLTKTERNEFLCAALDDAFTPRFAALKERLTALVKTRVAEMHPRFIELRADKASREYVSASSGLYVRVLRNDANICLREPNGLLHRCEFDPDALFWRNPARDSSDYCDMEVGVDYPSYKSPGITLPDDHPIVIDHDALWSDLFEAIDIGRSIAWAYSTREKLEADFPHLVKYLPARVSAVRAIAVPVADLIAKFSALGIPPEPVK